MHLTGPGLAAPRSLRWPGVLAVLATLGLLLVFQQVVRQAVEHGELRRRANALLLQATWRCRSIHDGVLREACLQRLAAVPRDNASLPR
jgi:hypothetical protein